MRLRRPRAPVLLLLLPALAAALSSPVHAKRDVTIPRDAVEVESPADTPIAKPPSLKAGYGTKDAPVDGLDGKPHAGPWVAIDSEKKKKPAAGGDYIGPKIPASVARLEKERSSEQGWSLIPDKNDGVMDDENRAVPKKGTTGTEGGVSEKSKMEKAHELKTGEKAEKKPDSPKEARPLPHSEQERLKDTVELTQVKGKELTKAADSTSTTEKARGAQGMQKPTDLPDKPHDSRKTNRKASDRDPEIAPGRKTLMDTMPYTEGTKPPKAAAISHEEEAEGLIQPLHSYLLALVMILFSEVGDKTFLVAALMAMRHDRLVVFSAAFTALIAMTILSAVLGHAVPTLLPRQFVAFAAAVLFLVFGAKMLREGLQMPKDSGVGEEMREVEAELEEKEQLARQNGRRNSMVSPLQLESGRGRRSYARGGPTLPEKPRSPSSSSTDRSPSPSSRGAFFANAMGGLNNLFSLVLSPAWVQTFVMTFLGEWGDRSQIATIAMAAGQDYWWVTGGAVTGHAICTGIAVIGGRALAGRVSMRVVTIGGAIAFLVFGVIYLLEATWAQFSPSQR